jgi:hypothetical protein
MSTTQSKSDQVISDWVGDIVALEIHVEEALDHQLKLKSGSSNATSAINRFHDAVRDSKQRAETYQEQYGTEPGNPIIKAGTNLADKAAGMVNMVRCDSSSRAIRDEFAAFTTCSLSPIPCSIPRPWR